MQGGGFTWFESREVARPVAASLDASVVWLRAWLDTEPEGYGRGACYVLGFSAGAMMAGALILDDPQRFAGAVLLSGAISLGGEFPAPPGRLTRMPVFYGHGTLDDVIPLPLVAETITYLCDRSGADVTRREYPHAHAISNREIDDIASWFER
jgi:phospholipase/carboxylesterase